MSDQELGNILDTAHDEGDYTAIYFSNPNDFKPYESGFDDSIHMELKRQLVDTPLVKPRVAGKFSDNSTGHHDGLFHRYQFFTPGKPCLSAAHLTFKYLMLTDGFS